MTHREPAGEGAGGDVSGVDVRGTISPLSAGAGGAGAGHAEYQVQRAPDEQAQARPRGDVHGEAAPIADRVEPTVSEYASQCIGIRVVNALISAFSEQSM